MCQPIFETIGARFSKVLLASRLPRKVTKCLTEPGSAIGGDLLRQVGTWVSQSPYPAGWQPPTSSNTHFNAFHGIDSQTHEFNRSFAGQFPPGDADAQMIDIQVFTEESVRLWNEIKQLAGYSFPDYNLR